MCGTNFCTDALRGAIYAERGLMAVTADMEHLRNREEQDRNMTTPIAHCVRPRFSSLGSARRFRYGLPRLRNA